jgi:hypothetical protein
MLRTNVSVIGITAIGGKLGDPTSERSDELVEHIGRQRSIDPSVSFSQLPS